MKKLILLATFFLINLDGAWCQSAISIYHLSDDSLKSLFVDFIEAEKACFLCRYITLLYYRVWTQ